MSAERSSPERPDDPERSSPERPGASPTGADRLALTALGTTALLVVTDPAALPTAEQVLRAELAAVDAACSRFRADSEISRLHEHRGRAVPVSPLLFEALTVAQQAAQQTDGLVDPTVGRAICALGYDRDFAELDLDDDAPVGTPRPVPGWWRIGLDAASRTVVLPRRVDLDLGATAKALTADRIATAAAAATGAGVLVSLGGDVTAAGPAPRGGWRLAVGDDHERALAAPDTIVSIVGGGLATSGIARRAWRRAGRPVHHIVDPRTGDVPAACWRTVTVAAATCVDANTASTAAVVLGPDAPAWLDERELPARLVHVDGTVTTIAGFPAPTGRI